MNRVQIARARRLGYVPRTRLVVVPVTVAAAPTQEALNRARDLSTALKTGLASMSLAMPWLVSL